jgi:hypothetical protein
MKECTEIPKFFLMHPEITELALKELNLHAPDLLSGTKLAIIDESP